MNWVISQCLACTLLGEQAENPRTEEETPTVVQEPEIVPATDNTLGNGSDEGLEKINFSINFKAVFQWFSLQSFRLKFL